MMDTTKIDNLTFADIDWKDYPKFTDANIDSADYDGNPMTDKQLDEINEDYDFVHEKLTNHIF